MSVQRLARRLAWAHRRDYGADVITRPKWAIDAYARDKDITEAQWVAARRLWNLIEAGEGFSAHGTGWERCDGTPGDPHGHMLHKARSMALASCALDHVATHLSRRPAHARVWVRAFQPPHPSRADLARLYHEGRSLNGEGPLRAIRKGLDLLNIHFSCLDRAKDLDGAVCNFLRLNH